MGSVVYMSWIEGIKRRYAAEGRKLPPYGDCWPWNVPAQELGEIIPFPVDCDKTEGFDSQGRKEEKTMVKETLWQ